MIEEKKFPILFIDWAERVPLARPISIIFRTPEAVKCPRASSEGGARTAGRALPDESLSIINFLSSLY